MANERARSFRKRPTAAESRLWKELKALRAQGFHFRRQVPIDDDIVDFACFDQRLIIEVDGSQHDEPAGLAADSGRDAHLRWQGFTLMRVRNADVMNNTSG
ncbi:MAG: endonuclease domain-containing protein, partial [Rhizobiales bacterium]|nr:endonuclease domain-containing protein [Hyphomicrobiales bacterium]